MAVGEQQFPVPSTSMQWPEIEDFVARFFMMSARYRKPEYWPGWMQL